ncbi:MAG: TonB-dependent receptor [Muribaculaceae bacterium]|nr:TonB-dependent receptor [Muribaculaceae bacterium]
MQGRKRISAALLGITCVSGQFCYGAGVDRNDSIATDLHEVEVKAKRKVDKMSSASPAPTIDANKVMSAGITDISDAMRRLPGVNLNDYGGSGGLKTIAVRGLGVQHTGVVYDGFPLSDIRNGAIDLSRYSLENVSGMTVNIGDRDELLIPARGAASAGTLNISTGILPDMLDSRPRATVRLEGGSFGHISPYLRISKSNGENLAFSASGEYTHSNNNFPFELKNGDYTTTLRRQNARIDRGHGEINGGWRPRPWNSIIVKGYYYGSNQHLPGPVVYYVEENNERLKEQNAYGQVAFKTRLPHSFSLQTLGKFNWSRTNYSDKNGKYPGGELNQNYIQKEAYGSGALFWAPLRDWSFDYSIDYTYQDLESNLATNNSPYRHTLLQLLAGRWKHRIFTVTAKTLFSLIGDGSHSDSESKSTFRFSPSITISIIPFKEKEFLIRASYKNIYRMPTFNELYFDHYGSVNLKPEDAEMFNIGITYGLTIEKFSLSTTLDGYCNIVRNKIVAVPFNMFINTMTNLGKVVASGVDFSVDSELSFTKKQGLILSGAYSYQRARIRTSREQLDWNKQVAYTPEHTGSVSLTWKNPWVNFVAHAIGSGSRYATSINLPSSRIAGYIDFGFTLYRTIRFGAHSIELRADLQNAFNRQYELIARYPMPGRNWLVSIKYQF